MKDRNAGLVYYVLDASRFDLRVKVGSTTNLSERLKSLAHQTMSRQQPLVLALEDGGELREIERHQQFDRHRAMGEWFRYDKELTDHVASMPHPVGWLADNPQFWGYAGWWQGFTGWAKVWPVEPEIELDEDGAIMPRSVDF